jgi:hypothetical protein
MALHKNIYTGTQVLIKANGVLIWDTVLKRKSDKHVELSCSGLKSSKDILSYTNSKKQRNKRLLLVKISKALNLEVPKLKIETRGRKKEMVIKNMSYSQKLAEYKRLVNIIDLNHKQASNIHKKIIKALIKKDMLEYHSLKKELHAISNILTKSKGLIYRLDNAL